MLISGPYRREISGCEPQTTNNRMEMMAALRALELLKERCDVDLHTDSQYLRNGMEKWLATWRRNGWRTADKKPVKNADLWQQLDEAARRHVVHWHWVRGHAGDVENERCDELANAAIRNCAGRAAQPRRFSS